MSRIKKTIETIDKNDTLVPDIIKVMDRETKKVIKIDANSEKDWKKKYLHCSGKEFI